MTESTQATLLRRKTRSQGQEVTENPLTSSRAVRLALTKSANDTVGLVLTVQGVAEETTGLDEMLGTLDDGLMLIGLESDGALKGIMALDMEMRAAVLEMETMGALLAQSADPRPPTRTDKTLCDPLLDTFLTAFPSAVLGTSLEGWLEGIVSAEKLESARAAGLILDDRDYRIVRMTVDLGVADRQGLLVIALPLVHEDIPMEPKSEVIFDWDADFREAVHDAPACLTAQLHRFHVSLATAQSLQVGSVLPLPGCTVSSVLMLAPDGQRIAQAKLGQAGGYRAVRLETAPALQLGDLPCHSHDEPAPLIDASLLTDTPSLPDAIDAIPNPMDQEVGEMGAQSMSENLPEMETEPLEIDVP